MTVASTVSTLPLSVILLTTPASVMMTVTAIQKTSVMKPVAYVRLQFAWQTQNAMDLTKFGIWLEVSKSQRVRVQASVKVKIDHKRQQNTIFLSARMFKRSFRLLHTGTKF